MTAETADEDADGDATDPAEGSDAEPADGAEPTDGERSTSADDGSGWPTSDADERAPNTLLNALIGAAVGLFLVFVAPLSPVIGGAVSGYLEGPDLRAGAKVGAIAGGMASLLAFGIVGIFSLFVLTTVPSDALFVVFLLVMLLGTVVAFLVGTFAIGGVLGAYVNREGIFEDV